MTPREKAQEIWMKIFQKQIEITGSADGNLCVEMALIEVDEVIEALHENAWQNRLIIDFWKEVKHELEKL